MKKNIIKIGAVLLLTILMCVSTLIGTGMFMAVAEEVPESDKTVVFSFPRDGDENYNGEWGHEDLLFMNGWSRHSAKRTHIFSIGSWNGNVCYCIEPGTPIQHDQILNSSNEEDYWKNYPSEYNNTITPHYIRLFIGRIMQYGYCGTVTTAWRSQNDEDADKMAHAVATQLIIWETIVGERDEDFNHMDTSNYDAILDVVSINHPLYNRIIAYYNNIVASVQTHSKIPSFFKKSTLNAQCYTLDCDGTKYTATLTDTNNVLNNYTFTTDNPNVTCSVINNKLIISSDTAITDEVTIIANKVNSQRKGIIVWGDGIFDTAATDIQDLVTYSAEVNDTVVGYMKVKVSYGSAKIVKTSEDGNVSGVHFTISGNVVNTTVTTGNNGEITVSNLAAGTYTVTEVVGNIYEPKESRTVTVISGETATVTFHNTLKRGNLVVTKTSEDGLVSGVKFRLYGKADNGLSVDEYAITDSSGKAYFNDVIIGSNYTLVEVDTKVYYITPIAQTVKIEWNKTTNKTVNNVLKTGELMVTKTAEDGIVGNVRFHLYGTSDSGIAVNLYATTNANGVAEFKDILIGSNYILEEVDVKSYYITPVKQTGVKIEWNKVTNKSFNNTIKCGDLKVVKTSEDDMVEGVKFRLVGTSDSGINVDVYAVTNAYGVAVFEDILIGSNYTLSEVDTEFKYITPVSQSVAIEWNKVTEKNFYNQLKRGDLTITKNSEDGLVEGITFRLYGKAECGQYVDVYATTDKSGKAYVKDILIGSAYTIEECNVSEKYITPVTQTNVVIEWEKVTQTTFKNVLKRGDLKVTKTAEDGLVESLTFHLYGYSLSGIYVDEYAVTNGNGISEFKDILIGSNYTLEECNCPDRYVIPERQNATIEWNKVCEIKVFNEIKKGTIVGKKIDEDGFAIASALFGLFNTDETIFTEETAIMVSRSNEIGVFGFEKVPYGNWIIRELKPAPAFVLNEGIYEVNISEDEQIIEITAVNRFICGSVRVWKLDEEVPDSKLPNAMFAVYCDVDGNGELNAEIDMLVGELTELEAGLYGMDNLRYNGYFLHEEKAPEGFIKDDNYYYFEIRNDGEVIYIENAECVGFINTPIKGKLKIFKIDSETKQPLANVGFRVMDAEGNIIEEAYTDENGIVTLNLRYGEYTFCEFSPLEGYYVNDEVYTFEITEDGEVIEIEFKNELIPELDIPQVGDNDNIHIWYLLATTSIIGILSMSIYIIRKKKKNTF